MSAQVNTKQGYIVIISHMKIIHHLLSGGAASKLLKKFKAADCSSIIHI
jgi:hypothetical protein